MKSPSEKIKKEMNRTRWIARILSSATTLIWGWWFIGSLIPKYFDEGKSFTLDPEELAVFIFFLIVLAGTIIGWWNDKWGGMILVAGYLTNAVGGYILAVSSHAGAGFMIGFIPVVIFLPFLISGILFLNVWMQKRKLIKASGK